jgi:hypothetical protein
MKTNVDASTVGLSSASMRVFRSQKEAVNAGNRFCHRSCAKAYYTLFPEYDWVAEEAHQRSVGAWPR